MDKFEKILDSIGKQQSCVDKVPEGTLEPVTEPEIEDAYRADLKQILGKYSLGNPSIE